MFYSALSQVIDDESFCSDEMAEYMRNRKNVSRDNNDIFSFRIQTLQSAALHISDYKKLIGWPGCVEKNRFRLWRASNFRYL